MEKQFVKVDHFAPYFFQEMHSALYVNQLHDKLI